DGRSTAPRADRPRRAGRPLSAAAAQGDRQGTDASPAGAAQDSARRLGGRLTQGPRLLAFFVLSAAAGFVLFAGAGVFAGGVFAGGVFAGASVFGVFSAGADFTDAVFASGAFASGAFTSGAGGDAFPGSWPSGLGDLSRAESSRATIVSRVGSG